MLLQIQEKQKVLFIYIRGMERIKHIMKSGIKQVAMIAPDNRISNKISTEMKTKGPKCFSVVDSRTPLDEAHANVVVFSSDNEDLYTSNVLCREVAVPYIGDLEKLSGIIDYLNKLEGKMIRTKDAMRHASLSNFYKTREYINRLEESGLFLPVRELDLSSGKYTSRHTDIPYYYKGNNRTILAMRHLMSLGYYVNTARIDNHVIDIYAMLGKKRLAIIFGGYDELDGLKAIGGECVKIVINESRIMNFLNVTSYTFEEFMAQKNYC